MQLRLPLHVQLNEFEQALLEQIDFSGNAAGLVETASGRASRQLMESLYRRDAVPASRQSYFTRPFPGSRGKSRMQVLQSDLQGRKSHIFEAPSFFREYVRYFIYGPDLPQDTIERFCQLASGADLRALRSFVRDQVRSAVPAQRKPVAEEFYKLALECFPDDPAKARSIRTAAKHTS